VEVLGVKMIHNFFNDPAFNAEGVKDLLDLAKFLHLRHAISIRWEETGKLTYIRHGHETE
jgi:hypothetical protein